MSDEKTKESNQFFDLPMPEGHSARMSEKLKEWPLDSTRWQQNQNKDFYEGFYCAMRLALSVTTDEEQANIFNHVSVDLLAIMNNKL